MRTFIHNHPQQHIMHDAVNVRCYEDVMRQPIPGGWAAQREWKGGERKRGGARRLLSDATERESSSTERAEQVLERKNSEDERESTVSGNVCE